MGMKPRPKVQTDTIYVEFRDKHGATREVVVLFAESHEEAERRAREELELTKACWDFWGSSTIVHCHGCGGMKKASTPDGHGALGNVDVVF